MRLHIAFCSAAILLFAWASPALSQTIDVGLAAPLTGPLATFGDQVRRGAEAAVDEVNSKGGLLGKKLALKTVDDGCDPQRSFQAARRLTQTEKVIAVIGHVCGPASVASAPVYAQMRIPMMVLAPGDHRLTEEAAKNSWNNIFLMAGSIETQGFAAGTYLARRYKGNGIALIYDQSAYGAGLADGFKLALKDRSSSPKFETALTGNVVDVGPTVEQLMSSNPSVVYLAMTPANAGALVKKARELGLNAAFVSGSAVGRKEFFDVAGSASEGVVGTTLPDARSSSASAEAVARLAIRGSSSDGYTLYAYAAIQTVAQAVEKAGSERFDAIEPVLRQQTFSTAVGRVKFDKAGDREVSQVAFTQWRDGKTTPFNTTDYWNMVRDAMSVIRPEDVQGSKRPILIDSSDTPIIEAKALQGVFWNTYFTRPSEPDAQLSTLSQSSYTLVLDLSAYNYRQIKETNAAGTAVDLRVKNALEKAPQEPLELHVRPIAISPLVQIDDMPVKSMPVERKKLVRPQEGAAATEEDQMVGRFKVNAIPLPQFSKEVAAGHVEFNVKVADGQPGCAVIAFTIWDFRDNPIDTLLQTVPVGDGKIRPDCTKMNPEALKGGFATLLNPVFSLGATGAQDSIMAALHLFQIKTDGQKKTIAIFVDKTQYKPPQPGQPASEQGVYGWQTSQWLSDYISDTNGLPARISAAWDNANNGASSPYAGVADELAGQIFGASVAEQPKADAAREALRGLAKSQDRPVVVVRMVDENNRKFYVPFNLISASGNNAGLPGPLTVVQPLQTERYEAPACIGSWTFALSKDTNQLDANIKKEMDALEAKRPARGEAWVRNASELKTYFQGAPVPPSAATPVPAEGLLLLAHHDQYGIYFDDVNGRVVAKGLRHSYPPGSIAILASCATAKPESGMNMLNGLNDEGVDAMIVSPFDVRIDYGSRMALEFAKVVRDNRAKGKAPTLAQMFAEATAATVKFFKDPKNHDSNKRLEDMGLEFILAGNPNLRLCAP